MDTPVAACLPMSSPVTETPLPTAAPAREKLQPTTPVSMGTRPRTLGNVVDALDTVHALGTERRKVLAAAVRASARLLNRPLELISADPKMLLPMLTQLTPVATNRSTKTIDNTRSL